MLQMFTSDMLACVLFAMEGVATISVPAHHASLLSNPEKLGPALEDAGVPAQTAQAVCKAAKDKAPSDHCPGTRRLYECMRVQ